MSCHQLLTISPAQGSSESNRWTSGTERGTQIQAWLWCLVLPQSVITGRFLTSLSRAFFICEVVRIKVLRRESIL